MTSELIRGDGLFPPAAYTRHDETPDTEFYGYPRKVVHIDDGAIAALGRLYAEVLPAGGQLLDLMSSWRTHLPRDFRAGEVIGLGLNAEEMTDNPQLTDHVVHDLNQAPRLPFDDEAFDGAMCAVSIQYVIHPLSLFRQVRRVLRPGSALRGLVLQPMLPHQGGRGLARHDRRTAPHARSYILRNCWRMGRSHRRGPVAGRWRSAVHGVGAQGVRMTTWPSRRSEERRVGKECRSRWSPYH